MRKRIVQIVDLGSGNLRSLIESFKKIGLETSLLRCPEEIEEDAPIVLPGVGSFRAAGEKASRTGFLREIKLRSTRQKILGICLGMQLLLDESEEGDSKDGIGLIPGRVLKLRSDSSDWRVPNIGWRNVYISDKTDGMLNSVLYNQAFYHAHSYFALPIDPKAIRAYSVFDNNRIPAVIVRGNVFGVQFHPEKSQDAGLDFLYAWDKISALDNRSL